ncbi:MAG: HNH endonuclease [Thermoplasmata archaeon]|nr:MAG: HNH endonuclease [Thermoplasmata archaeon]
MPPPGVKTVRDLIYWQYSELLSQSEGSEKSDPGFSIDTFEKLRGGEMSWVGSMGIFLMENEREDECVYCGSTTEIIWDQLIPKNRGGLDMEDNTVQACKSCSSSKGDRGIYEWFGIEEKEELPLFMEGKYLKLLFDLHDKYNTLDTDSDSLKRLCDICEVGYLCDETKLTVLCLESVLTTKWTW